MRYHKAALAALATHPSHQFDREGVLVLKERHDSFFRRSEVSSERWCRLRGNLLCYFKTRDHWSEAVGVLVLEHCAVTLEDTAPLTFTIEFGTGCHQVCEAATETDRDAWVTAIRTTALAYLAQQVATLQQRVAVKLAALESLSPAKHNKVPPTAGLELSLCCDNLRCDGPGLPPASCVAVQLRPHHSHAWATCHTTETIQGSSNPVFMASVVLGGNSSHSNISNNSNSNSSSIPVDDSCRVRLVVRRVLEPLTQTSTVIGMALTSVGAIRQRVRQRLALVSLTGEDVGFVSITSWTGDTAGGGANAGDVTHSTPTHAQPPGGCHHRRTQSLPPRLSCHTKLPQPPQLCPSHTNQATATYRFHSGLGGDIAVVEMMAESKLTYTLPQQLLGIWMGAERAWQEEVAALGELGEPWTSRQRALTAMHSSRNVHYQASRDALLTRSCKGSTLKRSPEKEDPLLETAPINLHLQRVWAQNESLRRTGYHDVHTHGAFAANALGCSHGGLLTLLQDQSRQRRCDASSRADCSRAAVESTRRLRASLADSLNCLVTAVMQGTPVAGVLAGVRDKIDLLLSALEPDMVEAAFDFLDNIKVPHSPSHLLTMASRNYSVHSNLAGYLSPESSLDKTIGLHAPQTSVQHSTDASNSINNASGEQSKGRNQSKSVLSSDQHINNDSQGRLKPSMSKEGLCKKELETSDAVEVKYYCSTDEPEPWDLIKLNLQASFICLSAKVNALVNSSPRVRTSPSTDKLAPLAQIDCLSIAGSYDILTTATTATTPDISATTPDISATSPDISAITAEVIAISPDVTAISPDITAITPDVTAITADVTAITPDVSPTEDDSGIGMEKHGCTTPENERTNVRTSKAQQPTDREESTIAPASAVRDNWRDDDSSKGFCAAAGAAAVVVVVETSVADNTDVCSKPKLASIMETSREDTIDSDDLNCDLINNVIKDIADNCKKKRATPISSDISSKYLSSTNSVSVTRGNSVIDNIENNGISEDRSLLSPEVSNLNYHANPNKNSPHTHSTDINSRTTTVPRNVSHTANSIQSTTGAIAHTIDVSVIRSQSAAPHTTGGTVGPPPVSPLASIVPSIVKLRGAVDGAVRTARLVHSLHRLQLPTDAVHQTHALQYRRDVCFAQALTTAVSALLCRLWGRAADQTFLAILQHLGPLLQFEGLLSCYSGESARLSDMVVAIEDLATVVFVMVADHSGDDPQPAVTGNRCGLRVVLPVPESVLCLLTRDSVSHPVTFQVTPVFFNIGINEEATLAGKLCLEGPQHRNNLDSFHRLAEYHHRYTKLHLPVENTKRVWSNSSSAGSLTELMARLKSAVQANKNKNTEVLTTAAAVTRAMAGLRFTACKSGKDRTGMSVTLEQTNLLAAEFDLARTEQQRSLQAMRSGGTRILNCEKNINVKKFAFNSIQLSMFPRNYVPPHGTYGAYKT